MQGRNNVTIEFITESSHSYKDLYCGSALQTGDFTAALDSAVSITSQTCDAAKVSFASANFALNTVCAEIFAPSDAAVTCGDEASGYTATSRGGYITSFTCNEVANYSSSLVDFTVGSGSDACAQISSQFVGADKLCVPAT